MIPESIEKRLRPVDAESADWRSHGICARHKDVKPDDFFPEGNFIKNSGAYRKHIAFLRTICAACPVIELCREEAETYGTKEGFWAGETASERKYRRFPNTRPQAS